MASGAAVNAILIYCAYPLKCLCMFWPPTVSAFLPTSGWCPRTHPVPWRGDIMDVMNCNIMGTAFNLPPYRLARRINSLMEFGFELDHIFTSLLASKPTLFFFKVWPQRLSSRNLGVFGSYPPLPSDLLSFIPLSSLFPVFRLFCLNDVVMYHNTSR